MSQQIVFLAGSPSATSKSTRVARQVAQQLETRGLSTRFFSLSDFDAADLLWGRVETPSVAAFLSVVRSAAAIVLSTPVYKATYSAGLKALIDLIPPDALVDRPALGIATTKLDSHGAEVSVAFQALFRFFRARGLPSLVVNDAELTVEETGVALTREAEDRLAVAVRGLQDAVARPASAAKT
ncbi:MAG: NAD(P)H-dependent oxidoreductase [Polyangiaceae bacterium]|jgi:FMN reductase